jgi:hypothetical protein
MSIKIILSTSKNILVFQHNTNYWWLCWLVRLALGRLSIKLLVDNSTRGCLRFNNSRSDADWKRTTVLSTFVYLHAPHNGRWVTILIFLNRSGKVHHHPRNGNSNSIHLFAFDNIRRHTSHSSHLHSHPAGNTKNAITVILINSPDDVCVRLLSRIRPNRRPPAMIPWWSLTLRCSDLQVIV